MKTVEELEHILKKDSYVFVNQNYNIPTNVCSCGKTFDFDGFKTSVACPVCKSKNIIDYSTAYTTKTIHTFRIGIVFSLETIGENDILLTRDELLYHINTEDFTIQKESVRKSYISYNKKDKVLYAYVQKPNGTYKKTKNILDFITSQKRKYTTFVFPTLVEMESISFLYNQTGCKEFLSSLQGHSSFWNEYEPFEKCIRYLHYFQQNPQIEQLVKSGYDSIALDLIRDNAVLTDHLNVTSKGSKMIPLPSYLLDYIKKERVRLEIVEHVMTLHTNGGKNSYSKSIKIYYFL